MKKVKIMMTTITVIAIVGGALAFKAKKFNTKLYCTKFEGLGKCTIVKQGFSITPAEPGEASAGSSSCTTTDALIGDCMIRPTYANQ